MRTTRAHGRGALRRIGTQPYLSDATGVALIATSVRYLIGSSMHEVAMECQSKV